MATNEATNNTTATEATTTEATWSPYKAAGVVNRWLSETEFDHKITPQMLYQYVDAGRVVGARDDEGHWKIRESDLREWFDGYIERKRTAIKKAKEEQAAKTEAA